MNQERRTSHRGLLLLCCLAILAAFVLCALWCSFLCDDAFITFRYSQNVALGHGPVFNPDEKVEGYTNFLWMILMAVVIKAGGAPELWSRLLSILFSIATLIVFLHHAVRRTGWGLTALAFPGMLALSAPFFVWSTGGLETASFVFFTFIAFTNLMRALNAPNSKPYAVSSLLFVLAALTRPEGAMLFALVVTYLIAMRTRSKISTTDLTAFILPFLIVYGAYFIWRWSYYGQFLPNSFYIKSPGIDMIGYGFNYFVRFVIESSLWVPAIVVTVRLIMSRGRALDSRSTLPFSIAFAYSLYVIYTGGDFMAMSRYLVPVLPIVYLLAFELTLSADRLMMATEPKVVAALILVVFLSANVYAGHSTRKIWHTNGIDSIGLVAKSLDEWSDVGRMLHRNSNPTDTISTTAAGAIPYYSELYTIDHLGLIAADLSRYRQSDGSRRPGHSIHIDPDHLLELKPHFLIDHPRIVQGEAPQINLGSLRAKRSQVYASYHPVGMELPKHRGLYLNFLLRKDVVGRIEQRLLIFK